MCRVSKKYPDFTKWLEENYHKYKNIITVLTVYSHSEDLPYYEITHEFISDMNHLWVEHTETKGLLCEEDYPENFKAYRQFVIFSLKMQSNLYSIRRDVFITNLLQLGKAELKYIVQELNKRIV